MEITGQRPECPECPGEQYKCNCAWHSIGAQHLGCLQHFRSEWTAVCCYMAADIGWLEGLRVLLNAGIVPDARATERAATVAILELLRGADCPWGAMISHEEVRQRASELGFQPPAPPADRDRKAGELGFRPALPGEGDGLEHPRDAPGSPPATTA